MDDKSKSKSTASQRSLNRVSKNFANSSSTPNLSQSLPAPLPATSQLAGAAGRMLLSRHASTPSMKVNRLSSKKKLDKIDDIMKDKQELENFLRSK